jgi:hypothetical protein
MFILSLRKKATAMLVQTIAYRMKFVLLPPSSFFERFDPFVRQTIESVSAVT